MAEPLLSVEDLKVVFHLRRGDFTAVDGISFSIMPGEVLGVVGESGAGKSMTGTAIMGLVDRPGEVSATAIKLKGERIDGLDEEGYRKIRGKRIGMVFQDPLTSLNPLYTVGEQLIETIRRHLPLSHEQAKKRAIELLADAGIPNPEERIGAYPHQFSGGMRQRVVISLALAAEPELVIADEPTSALDVSVQAQIIKV
jgi:peptide/nickel transport system ATP-binding protein